MKFNRIVVICQNPECKKEFYKTPYRYNRSKAHFCCKACANHKTPKDRFWNYVKKTKSCWIWTGSKINGYGNMGLNGGTIRAHRFSYELHFGEIPQSSNKHDFCVLHKCDNPACVNPKHLRLGSQLENIKDRHKKGRDYKPKGLLNPSAKLDYAIAELIRVEYAKGKTSLPKLAKKWGVGTSTIHRIVKNKVWVNG